MCVYREQWEKVNFTWHTNGTVSYVPTKKFFFNREASSGSEDDIVQTLNIPLIVSLLFYAFIVLCGGGAVVVLENPKLIASQCLILDYNSRPPIR